ncbi:MAG: tail fiber domain-containing protein, partial [Candidatus Azobacteroides sp.]|nr:tail fiber domain-containing protein [Candidatus Azobacteroides sp.]
FNTTGYENAAFGEQALSGSIDGHYNTAIGCRALWSVNQTAGGDVGYGHGNNNTAVGYESLREITTGSSNVGVGMHALRVNSSGSNNIAMGNYSLTSNTTGGGNVAIGDQALYSNTEGGNNVAVGNGALRNSTTTDYVNIAVGTNALYSNTTGGLNTAVGTNTLQSNTTGFTNVAIGYNALQSNTEGGDNTANGYYAMENNIRGSENCAYGAYALYGNTTGSDNTAIGHSALYNNITGFGNTAVGVYANTGNCGNDNIAIGDMAYAGSNNSTAIGAYAQTTADNQVMIGNSSVTSIRGYVPWTTISDGRVKKNIRSDVPGLAFIKLLQPVTYNLDTDAADKILKSGKAQENENDSLPPALAAAQTKAREAQLKRKQTGFVAQDVEKAAQSIGYDFSGVDADESGAGLYGLRYSEFIVPLVKAVQELSAQNDAKDSMIVSMQHRIDQLEEGNDATTVSALKQQVETLTGLVNQLLEKGNNPSPDAKNLFILGASLEQNFPNPFNHSTTIKYTLPQEARSGKIVIADLSGRVFKQIPISKPGSGSVTIEGGSLYAGTYYYSLYVDNTLIDTKKMVLTK